MNAATSTKVRACLKAAFIALLLCFIAVEIAAADEAVAVDPPDRVARLSYTEGDVSLAPAGTDEWAEAVLNRPLTGSDRLALESDARAELQVGSSLIHLGPDSDFSFLEVGDDVLQMSLTAGVAIVRVRRLGEHESIQVETPHGRVTLLHPGEYTIEVDRERDETVVTARNGEAEVLAGDDSHVLRKGEALAVRGADEHAAVESRDAGSRSAFEQWAAARDRELQAAESASSRYVSSEVIGHEDLDGHGEWLHESDYGDVWRPSYVSFDWAPYRYGRWVWIAPWGYTWIDDARWGFAPFHYGRWAQIHNRWCWVPGPRHLRPVYSPALVGWTGGAGTRVGWFPLGPRDAFVPGYRHSPRYVRRVNECNTRWLDRRALYNLETRRANPLDYRFAREPNAITMVDRDRFLAGRSLAGARFGVDTRDVEGWRGQSRPPALTPYRESVLGGAARTTRFEMRDADRQRQQFPRYRLPSRIPFEAERRAIEANGGTPPSRSQLHDTGSNDGPKRGDDFRGDAWRAQREQRSSVRALTTAETSVATPRTLHELGTVRPAMPAAEQTWRTQRPNTAIDSVARDREARAVARDQERGRQSDSNTRLRTPSRTWNSGESAVVRNRGSMRAAEPVERSQPRRVETAPSRDPAPSRNNGSSRGDGSNTPSPARMQTPGRSLSNGSRMR